MLTFKKVVYICKVIKNENKMKTIETLRNEKQTLLIEVNKLTALKKKLFSNVDITQPMSIEQKSLNKEVADLFSKINLIVKEIRILTNL